MLSAHSLKNWSKTQSLIALSSGENEFYGALKASAEGLGIIAMVEDFGINVTGKVLGDASAALGIIHRKGLGRTRHIDTGLLWIQQTAAEKRLEYAKVLGAENPADLLTKYLTAEVINRHCEKINTKFEEGRAEAAPQLSALYNSKALWELEEAESEEEPHDEDNWQRLQCVVNMVWHDKWKQAMKHKAQGGGKDKVPLLIPLPQGDVVEYARQKGLLKEPTMAGHGLRGPTKTSENPTLISGTF